MDFKWNKISKFKELADQIINKGCHTVIPEYDTNISDIVDRTEMTI